MAKKGAEPQLPDRKKNIFVLRGTDEFKAWMEELAERVGLPVTLMVEHSMRDLAKKHGHPLPPKRY